jgi:hypothetical protein
MYEEHAVGQRAKRRQNKQFFRTSKRGFRSSSYNKEKSHSGVKVRLLQEKEY